MKLKLLLFLMLLLPMSSMAQTVAYAVLKDSTLTFYYGNNKPTGAYDVENLIKDRFVCKKEWDSVCNQIYTVVFDQSFKEYRPKSCSRWFDGCKNLTSIKGIKENLNTSEVTDMNGMFLLCENLTSLDVSGFNTGKVTDMSWMFYGCNNLTSLDVSGFKTENVTDMWGMFNWCENLTSLDVSGFNTEKVTDMRFMFSGCFNLTSLDVSGFNTENVNYMNGMFAGCESLKTIYVGDGWNTSNVTESVYMFNSCPNIIGGKGTKYDKNHIDVDYAHIDGGESNPGYFTKKTK